MLAVIKYVLTEPQTIRIWMGTRWTCQFQSPQTDVKSWVEQVLNAKILKNTLSKAGPRCVGLTPNSPETCREQVSVWKILTRMTKFCRHRSPKEAPPFFSVMCPCIILSTLKRQISQITWLFWGFHRSQKSQPRSSRSLCPRPTKKWARLEEAGTNPQLISPFQSCQK